MIPELSHVCGGRAVEILASRGDSRAFQFTAPLCKYRDCNFSYAGIKNTAQRYVIKQERIFGEFNLFIVLNHMLQDFTNVCKLKVLQAVEPLHGKVLIVGTIHSHIL